MIAILTSPFPLPRSLSKHDTLKAEGYLHTLKEEVVLMVEIVRCLDAFQVRNKKNIIIDKDMKFWHNLYSVNWCQINRMKVRYDTMCEDLWKICEKKWNFTIVKKIPEWEKLMLFLDSGTDFSKIDAKMPCDTIQYNDL